VHLKLLKSNVERIITNHIKNKNIDTLIDMGCGDMPYAPIIKPHVNRYIGADVEGNPRADYFFNLLTNRIDDLPDNYSDLVWSVQVLEHVDDPQLYLRECLRLLKPGKKLILSTHGQWLYHPDPVDNWRWTSTGLVKEVENAGFKIIQTWGMMGLLSMSAQFFQDACLIHLPLVKYWKLPFCFIMQRIIALFEWFTNLSATTRNYVNKDASVFFVIAEKPHGSQDNLSE
jgi:SAM-dependent methyltransferase